MNVTSCIERYRAVLIAFGLCVALDATAEVGDIDSRDGSSRYEAWLVLQNWTSLNDLQPAAGGSFKQLGYGLGGAVHWPLRWLEDGELLLGVEGAVIATDSDVPILFDDLLARHGYLALSAKWFPGDARNISLDAGVSYHLLDIAQLETDYYLAGEFESWEESAAGFFVGTSWYVGEDPPEKTGGLSIGLKVHFLDFGTVRDEDVLVTPVLGPNAGELDGPLFALQIGYSWR